MPADRYISSHQCAVLVMHALGMHDSPYTANRYVTGLFQQTMLQANDRSVFETVA